MLRILNAEPDHYSCEARKILDAIGEVVEEHLTQAELVQRVADFGILIVRLGLTVDREVITAGRRLRAIVTATTGLDHIDVDFATSRGIDVLSLKGEIDFLRTIPATAEHTWALLLALIRNIPRAVESVRKGQWNRDELRGHDLNGKQLGIVGLGRIGEKVANYGLAFGTRVAAFSPYREHWPSRVERCATLEALLSKSDVLSLHLPLNDETFHMIGRRELRLLPKGAYLINTSRGRIIDEQALVELLNSGHLAGAALDVVETELDHETRHRSPLLKYARTQDNLLITPHIGGATVESMRSTEIFMARKLLEWYRESISPNREVESSIG